MQLLKSIPGLDSHSGKAGSDVFVHFTGGGLAGITAASATYPLDLVRTRLAAQVYLFSLKSYEQMDASCYSLLF